jgi:hypothetical protein
MSLIGRSRSALQLTFVGWCHSSVTWPPDITDIQMVIPIPVGVQSRATASGAIRKKVTCSRCGNHFEYTLMRKAAGAGTSALFLDNDGADYRAAARARDNLRVELERGHDPIPCPKCGIYQERMVDVLHERHGYSYDPNEYADERAKIPEAVAWANARRANTALAYQSFMRIWPDSQYRADAHVCLDRLDGQAREIEWEDPAVRSRSMVYRVISALVVFIGLILLSLMFGKS